MRRPHEDLHELLDEHTGHERDQPEAQVAAAARLVRGQLARHRAQIRDELSRPRDHQLAGAGELHAVGAIALEKVHAQHLLDVLQRAARRGLREPELAGRSGHRAMRVDREQQLELAHAQARHVFHTRRTAFQYRFCYTVIRFHSDTLCPNPSSKRERKMTAPLRLARALGRTLLTSVVLASMAALLPAAIAQPYPSKPVRLVVPYAPGGAGDVIARIVSQRLGTDLGTSVIVENRPGAGGMIGAMAVASAPADGYTALLGNTTEMVVGPYLAKNASYETQRDFKPVALAGMLPQLLIANPAVGAKSLAEFVALAKAKPGQYSYATAGTGSTAHIAGALLEK